MMLGTIVVGFFALLGAIFLLAWLSSMFILLQPREAVMVYSWLGGSVEKTITTDGLHFKQPWPFQTASEKISLHQQMLVTTNRARSKEEAFFNLEVKAIVQIQPEKVKEATFNIDNPKARIKSSVSEAVKRVVPTLKLDEVYSDRTAIASEVKDTLNEAYAEHGWECLDVIVEDPELEKSMEEASNKRIENRRRAEAAEDLKRAIFLESTAEAEAASESLRLRTRAAGEAKKFFTEEIIESIEKFRTSFPDLDPALLMDAMDGLDRRDSIVTASNNPGSVIVVDTHNEKGRQYADMAAFNRQKAKSDDQGNTHAKVETEAESDAAVS